MSKIFIKDLELKDKLVVLRSDLNVPIKDKIIQDDTRIRANLKTLKYLHQCKARTIILSHLGRPKGKIVEELRLQPIAIRLSELLGWEISYFRECVGAQVKQMLTKLQPGGFILLENLRFHKGEIKNDNGFAQQIAHGADYFINDAFGVVHRMHASTHGITKYVTRSAIGFLLKKEIDCLSKIINKPKHPFFVICGGAKVSDKMKFLIKLLSTSADRVLIGGGMAFTFLRALGYETGYSLIERDQIPLAKSILQQYGSKLELPSDILVSPSFNAITGEMGPLSTVSVDRIPAHHYGLDIGPETIKRFTHLLLQSRLVFWNGPMGVFEFKPSSEGTYGIARTMAHMTKKAKVITIVGGGDSAAAIVKMGLENQISHISTGGGASLTFLGGGALPGMAMLTDT